MFVLQITPIHFMTLIITFASGVYLVINYLLERKWQTHTNNKVILMQDNASGRYLF